MIMLLTTAQAKAVKAVVKELGSVGAEFRIRLGKGTGQVTIESDGASIVVRSPYIREVYGDIETFAARYQV